MKAAWYERQGAAGDVLVLGEMEDAQPRAGEVRIRVAFSGVNPGDIKKREDSFHVGCRIHGSFRTAIVRASLMRLAKECRGEWLGRRVWCYGAQSYRPFGTAAESTVMPLAQVVPLPASVPVEQGACLGIPGITAHQAVHGAGPVQGRTVLVQGAAGAVGSCAVQLAHRAQAHVIA